MLVVLKDKQEGSLVVLEATHVFHQNTTGYLHICHGVGEDVEEYRVEMDAIQADYLIMQAVDNNKLDLRAFPAEYQFNEDDEE